MVKIEEGKFYKTRDGRKVGPFSKGIWTDGFPWEETTEDKFFWSDEGKCQVDGDENDLISEWQEGPLREIRRREIVPGVYGGFVNVDVFDKNVFVSIRNNPYSAEQLREAAHLFNQLAEVLEESQ